MFLGVGLLHNLIFSLDFTTAEIIWEFSKGQIAANKPVTGQRLCALNSRIQNNHYKIYRKKNLHPAPVFPAEELL